MRTQLILTTAAVGLASSLGAIAQVYSVNAVGYINVSVPAKKYVLVANQLKAASNAIKDVIPTALAGTTVFTYANGAGFDLAQFDDLDNAWTKALNIPPGAGFFVQGAAADQTITFVGEVPQGNLSTSLKKGLNLVGSQVPQAGKLTADLKLAGVDGDIVYQWDSATQKYKSPNAFDSLDNNWLGGDPAISVGEGFFIQKAADVSWDRTFSVNQ